MLVKADTGLNVGCYLRHRLLHVEQVCLLSELASKLLLVGFRRQDLFHFFDAVPLRLQHMAHASECELDDVCHSFPLARRLEGTLC